MNAVLAPTQTVQKGATVVVLGQSVTLFDFDPTPKGMYIWVTVDGRRKHWSWKKFLAKLAETTDYAGQFSTFEDQLTPLLGLLPDEERSRVVQRVRDLMELRHGDPFGTLEGPHPEHTIRPEYDPEAHPDLLERIHSKTAELRARGETGVEKSTLYAEYNHLFKEGGDGILALIRAKYRKRLSPILDMPKDIVVIARRVAVDLARRESGTVSIKDQTADTAVELDLAGFTLPKAKMRDLIDIVSVGLHLRRPGKQRKNVEARPVGHVYGSLRALYPGHIVELDSTPLNLVCRIADGLTRTYLDLLTAIDKYSRDVFAIRLVEKPHTAIDVNLLLYDMLGADFVRSTWKSNDSHLWIGLPEEIHVPDDGSVKFGMKIKSVVVDLGSQFNNTTTLAVLALHGIKVFFTPPRRGPAKGMVESFQAHYSRLVQGLPGDKGRSPDNSGSDSKKRVLPTIDHVEQMLWEFISTVYNRHKHRKLLDPEARKQKISPIDMMIQHVRTFGKIHVPLRQDFRIAFLKEGDAELEPEGFQVGNGVIYVADELDELRQLRDNLPRLLIRYDPRDYTRAYFWHWTRCAWILARDYETFKGYVQPGKETVRRAAGDEEVPRVVQSEREETLALGWARKNFKTRVVKDHRELLRKMAADKRAGAGRPLHSASAATPVLPPPPPVEFDDTPVAGAVGEVDAYVPKKVHW